ncbi:hypothetical protein BMWSH_2598 [Priestia megaterium WSH-002]|uniref:Uncharacterized protein n=1 Tax=Priestia megaterium (strain WSH-002) TaxID=1006007 RepID=A0A8D3X0K0_PRIMW|nr:hypothetical protein BMWSH_2598 [Priestia megaterium WSH-002]
MQSAPLHSGGYRAGFTPDFPFNAMWSLRTFFARYVVLGYEKNPLR